MPKVIDHDQRRRDILEVTRSLIIKGGIEAATMREIAREAGFANGALKHYFPGKDEIIQGTYEMSLTMMTEAVVAAVADKKGLTAIRAHCEAAMPLDDERILAGRVQIAFWERAASNPDLDKFYLRHIAEWRASLATHLAEGRAAGEILTLTPDDQLIDEIILLNSGANVMSLIAPLSSTIELQRRHLEGFFARLAQP